VAGAVVERLGGFGAACLAFAGAKPPPWDAVRYFNFPEGVRSSIVVAPLAALAAAAAGAAPDGDAAKEPACSQLQPASQSAEGAGCGGVAFCPCADVSAFPSAVPCPGETVLRAVLPSIGET
jgi:hypothetical protein